MGAACESRGKIGWKQKITRVRRNPQNSGTAEGGRSKNAGKPLRNTKSYHVSTMNFHPSWSGRTGKSRDGDLSADVEEQVIQEQTHWIQAVFDWQKQAEVWKPEKEILQEAEEESTTIRVP